MGFDKDYPNRKDHRKPFRGAKAVDHSCRNNGACGYCSANRQHSRLKNERAAKEEIKRWRELYNDEYNNEEE